MDSLFFIRIEREKVFYKSVWGEMATIIVLTFVIVYSINQFIYWESFQHIKNLLVKKVIQNNFFLKKDPHQLVDIIDSQINPFDNNSMINIPLLYISNEEQAYRLDFLEDGQYKTLIVDLNNQLDNYLIIIFVKCIDNEQNISGIQNCASQEYSDKFFNQIDFSLKYMDFI
ncbi:unnamed protein product [Paramecium sonneborni]|uniref:Uncharacterized protein n=1 Tax=Paramecium sonneborni TaxID=65129 RepID=A0A8S1QRV3_9CILI|nr:unnamed protein product [Paramecium sonneborni]